MKKYAWYMLGPVGAVIELLIGLIDKMRRPKYIIDWEHTRKMDDIVIGHNLAKLNDELITLHKKREEINAILEQEVQCKGCGYFHNVRRCPKCTRMNNENEKVSWITSGRAVSDCSHDTIYHIRPDRERSFIDVVPQYKYIPAINILKDT